MASFYPFHSQAEQAPKENEMVRSAGIEPTTTCLEGRCSIQLSYERNHGYISHV